jgi:hypothetical protein
MSDTGNDKPTTSGLAQENLQEAADQGQLPGVGAEDAAEQRGEDHSTTADPEEKADEAGGGDVVGGINMR